jgi:spore maturation protein CgeB
MKGGTPDIVIIGLSLSSSWGNGHATTYRGLMRGLAAQGLDVLFLEQDVPWYAAHRDMEEPEFGRLALYQDRKDLMRRFGAVLARTGAVIIGSYVQDGVAVIDAVADLQPRLLAFYDIDTPVTLARLERGEEEYLARRQVPLFDVYLSFTGGPTLVRLREVFGARQASALYCSVDERIYRPLGLAPRWDLGYLGTYSPDRQPTLDRLLVDVARRLPGRRFVVAGPQYPDDIHWPGNVERIEHLPPAEHPAFYGAQRWTLNVTRADMIEAGWSPSVRLFEAASCGTPVISDVWDGLGSLLPVGRAIRLARTTDDVVAVLERGTEAERSAQADAARTIVLARHTGQIRARELVAALASAARRRSAVESPAMPRPAAVS